MESKRPSARLCALLALISAAVVGLDQLTKYLARERLSAEPLTAIPHVLELRLQMNDGASLGIMSGNRALLVAISAVAAVLVAAVIFAYKKISTGGRVSLALVLGGAVGNLIDRAASGFVTDMIRFPFLSKIPLVPDFVCNIADIAITFGMVGLVVCLLVDDHRERAAAKAALSSEDEPSSVKSSAGEPSNVGEPSDEGAQSSADERPNELSDEDAPSNLSEQSNADEPRNHDE